MTRLTDEQPELGALVHATREVYLEMPPPAVRQQHVAMIVAESRRLATAEAAAAPARGLRFVRRLCLAFALAAALAGVFLVAGESDDQPAPRVSDRPSPAPLSDRAASPQQHPRSDEARPRRRPALDTRSGPAPAPPARLEPEALAERRPTEPDPAPAPAPQRGFGGPDSSPEPLKGALDTEPPIPATPESGAPAPDVPPP